MAEYFHVRDPTHLGGGYQQYTVLSLCIHWFWLKI